MDNETALNILARAIPVLERAAHVEKAYSPELRDMIRSGIREYKAAYRHITKQLQPKGPVHD